MTLKEDADGNEKRIAFLELVRQAGREYAGAGVISEDTMAKLSVPMIPEEQYAAICNQTQ